VIVCVVTPVIGHADVRISVPVTLSTAAEPVQVHRRLEYTADAALPGTVPTVFVMLSEQVPSVTSLNTGPLPSPNCTSQVAGLVLASLTGIDTVSLLTPLLEVTVVGATMFVSEPFRPL